MPADHTARNAAEPRKLAAELQALHARFGQARVSLGELVEALGDRTYTLLLVLLALPFFTPVSLLGLSTIVGLVIAYLGVRLALGMHPHLPERMRARRLPPRFFGLLLRSAAGVIRMLERCSRKRLPQFSTGRLVRRAVGSGIVVAAVLLMLPIPVPFTNTLPAATIACLALGLLEEDGKMVLAGFAFLALSAVFFGAIGFFGVETFDIVHRWLEMLGKTTPTPTP